MPSDVTRSKIGDLSKRTEEVLLLLVADFEDLRDKLSAEKGKILYMPSVSLSSFKYVA